MVLCECLNLEVVSQVQVRALPRFGFICRTLSFTRCSVEGSRCSIAEVLRMDRREAADRYLIPKETWVDPSGAYLGLRTGLTFDVIDLDSEDAVDALENARAGSEPAQGPVVRTVYR
jgi:hypothetical protein